MANTIKIKNSGVTGAIPSSLADGEIALNRADGILFYKNTANTIISFPNVLSSDLDDLQDVAISNVATGDFVQWNGTSWINQSDGLVPSGGLEGQILAKTSDISHDLEWIDNYTGDLRILCKNDSGFTISKGSPVSATGSVGDRIQIEESIADGTQGAEFFLGVASQDIDNGSEGYVQMLGEVRGLDTSTYTVGDILYISPDTPGVLTNIQPSAPDLSESIAIVTRVNSSSGIIFVRMWSQGESISSLHDVSISNTVSIGDTLSYDGAKWINQPLNSFSITSQIETDVQNLYVLAYMEIT